MKLIVGLGNPGEKYATTRHNVGFMVADTFIAVENWPAAKTEKKFFADITQGQINAKKIIIAKPLTFMNDSGRAVLALKNFYKLSPEDIIVVHDDKDLPLGEIRLQTNRGDAGHNGVKSIIDNIGTQNFTRVRVGVAINDPRKMSDTAKFVLAKFGFWEKKKIKTAIASAVAEIKKII